MLSSDILFDTWLAWFLITVTLLLLGAGITWYLYRSRQAYRRQSQAAVVPAEESLYASNDQFRHILDSYSDGVLVLDEQHIIRYANPRAHHLLQRSELESHPFGYPIVSDESVTLEVVQPNQQATTIEMHVHETVWKGLKTYIISLKDTTAHVQAQKALQASEARFRKLAENAPDIIFRYRLAEPRGYDYISPSVTAITGYTPEEFYADPDLDLKILHPEARPEFYVMSQSLETSREPIIMPYIRKDGRKIWIEQRHWIVQDEDGRKIAIEGISLDVTERKQIEESLHHTNQRMSHWINDLQQYNREMTVLNAIADSLQGCTTVGEAYRIVEHTVSKLFEGEAGVMYSINSSNNVAEIVASWGNHTESATLVPEHCLAIQRKRAQVFENAEEGMQCQHFVLTNSRIPVLCVPLTAHSDTIGVLRLLGAHSYNHQDPERHKQLAIMVADHLALALTNLHLREQLHEQAIRDPLTQLFNRRYLEESLKRELRRAMRHKTSIGIIMMDIDHFKSYNDTYGHDGGDALLHEVGRFIQSNIRGEDIACRFGGEEFTLILPGASLEDTHRRAENLRTEMKHIHATFQGKPLGSITASLGVASFPEHGLTAEAVITAADRALYRAKATGRDRVCVSAHAR